MVAIKDMDMPSCCYECDLHNYHNCDLTNDGIEKYLDDGSKHPNCPLVEIEERKVGKWIKKYQYGNDYCSECNYENCGYGYPKFCPNCGADMRGAENENV